MAGVILWMLYVSRTKSATLRWMPTKVIPLVSLSVVLALLATSQLVQAHDSWISRHQFYDPGSGAWCCDEHDCSALDNVEVREMGGGFIIEGRHFIARQRILPSSDGQYWACFNTGGKGPHEREKEIRCFFAPMNA